MRPSARVQAAIELLDSIIAAARSGGSPADRLIADYFKLRRYAGSKDRRAVREMVYSAIRACGPVPESGRAAMLRLAELDDTILPLFDGDGHGPAPVGAAEIAAVGGIAPDWLEQALAKSDIAGDEAAALLERAPLDIRVNTLKSARHLIDLPEAGEHLAAPNGLRFPSGTNVEQWDAWKQGQIEVQDGGSQLACGAVAARPGEAIVDLCAGAGGKTIGLAAAMENKGWLVAADIDRGRLSKLEPRARRSGTAIIEPILLDPGRELERLADYRGKADAVLVDAPCSGTGTWRRNPEARWRLGDQRFEKLLESQARLLGIAAQLVRPGGRLIYVTCSLLDEEGADQIDAFLRANDRWSAAPLDLPAGRPRGKGTRLTPMHDGTDGFFIAQLTSA
ncbi:RsmB/NOP family class I SAM-dependent RNA methyltransferase [Altererythrobacter aquiaggeris]|uniref:RsmB/NOP family class I SAM-dependent RNA methyltransferase n=1 Tax=Aestuarierythrobacter aquiaggeris TaxID=1898396 RepID=UPI00301A0EBB